MSDEQKPEIVVSIGYYLPGFQAGGPIRSVANIIEQLGAEYHFRVFTRDRDLGSKAVYPGIETHRWMPSRNAEVLYVRKGLSGLWKTIRLLRSVKRDSILYLNSFFSMQYSILAILMRRFGLLRCTNIVLAPRGEFSPGALRIKALKKRCYFRLAKWLHLYEDVLWHASTDYEAADLLCQFPGVRRIDGKDDAGEPDAVARKTARCSEVGVASDIPVMLNADVGSRQRKQPGHLSVIFVSRVSPMKNLEAALKMLDGLQGEVVFDIYGPIEDAEYWESCQRAIPTLPANVQVHYCGIAKHEELAQVFSQHDLFLLPTRGENFGHAICEAMTAGLPVLISDCTPWRNLERFGAGWDIGLSDVGRFRAVLQQCIDADDAWYGEMSEKAMRFGVDRCMASEFVEANRVLFRYAFERSRRLCSAQSL